MIIIGKRHTLRCMIFTSIVDSFESLSNNVRFFSCFRGVHTQLAGQVNVDGAEVHYEKVGNGKNVLLLTPGAIGQCTVMSLLDVGK